MSGSSSTNRFYKFHLVEFILDLPFSQQDLKNAMYLRLLEDAGLSASFHNVIVHVSKQHCPVRLWFTCKYLHLCSAKCWEKRFQTRLISQLPWDTSSYTDLQGSQRQGQEPYSYRWRLSEVDLLPSCYFVYQSISGCHLKVLEYEKMHKVKTVSGNWIK